MDFRFIDDFEAVTWDDNGVLHCVPTKQLSEEDKQFIYEEKAKNGYC